MTAELGHFALCFAFILALIQASVPLYAAQVGNRDLAGVAVPAAQSQGLMIIVAFLALTQAYVASDFSVLNVAENSHTAKPLIYKISGVWGNHEGSMVLWVLILALFGVAVASVRGGLDDLFRARVLAIQGLIGAAFLAFILFTSNPFVRLDPAPFEGRSLNPLLQDPGLAIHPPFLYLGYVGFSMAFSFAVAALIGGQVDRAWARWVRPWTLAAWMFLTIGIGLGSWWAYNELGWGGWWFWDPVENASLMPWLLGTALLHSALVVERRGALKHWTILLAILTFSFSLLGTFLVRSGVLTSVHAFANDPERGVFILAILLGLTGGALALYAVRSKDLSGGGGFAPISREGALVLNNLFLVTACVTVCIGTLYPLLLDAVKAVAPQLIGDVRISVGPPYFNQTVVPLMIPLFLAVPVGAMLAWKQGDLAGVLARLKWAGAGAVVLTLGLGAFGFGWSILALPAFALAAWLVLGSVVLIAERAGLGRTDLSAVPRRLLGVPRLAWGTAIAHGGLGILIAGIAGVSLFQAEVITRLSPGESLQVGRYEVRFEGVTAVEGPNYVADRASLVALRDGRTVAALAPERRHYPASERGTSEVGLHSTLLTDLYVTLGEPARAAATVPPGQEDAWTIRAYVKPLINWIWGGTLIMVLGGGLALSDRRAARRQTPQPENTAGLTPSPVAG